MSSMVLLSSLLWVDMPIPEKTHTWTWTSTGWKYRHDYRNANEKKVSVMTNQSKTRPKKNPKQNNYLSISVKASSEQQASAGTRWFTIQFSAAPVSVSIKSPILTLGNNFFCFITNAALLFDKSAARSWYNSQWKSGMFYIGWVTVKTYHNFSFMFFCAARAPLMPVTLPPTCTALNSK